MAEQVKDNNSHTAPTQEDLQRITREIYSILSDFGKDLHKAILETNNHTFLSCAIMIEGLAQLLVNKGIVNEGEIREVIDKMVEKVKSESAARDDEKPVKN